MKTLNEEISGHIMQVLNKTVFTEKKKILKFSGISLFPSEIHLLLVIKNDISTNATEIAKQLHLTKGAVSQTLTRLEKKGVIAKTKDPYNKNELTVSITDFGKQAYELCQSGLKAFNKAHDDYLAGLNAGDKEVILNFLKHMEKSISGFSR